jgi:hypothetical protein
MPLKPHGQPTTEYTAIIVDELPDLVATQFPADA